MSCQADEKLSVTMELCSFLYCPEIMLWDENAFAGNLTFIHAMAPQVCSCQPFSAGAGCFVMCVVQLIKQLSPMSHVYVWVIMSRECQVIEMFEKSSSNKQAAGRGPG